jgi:hypothetical protein
MERARAIAPQPEKDLSGLAGEKTLGPAYVTGTGNVLTPLSCSRACSRRSQLTQSLIVHSWFGQSNSQTESCSGTSWTKFFISQVSIARPPQIDVHIAFGRTLTTGAVRYARHMPDAHFPFDDSALKNPA